MSALTVTTAAKVAEVEESIRKIAELHVNERARRRDEEFLMSEALVRAIRACAELAAIAREAGQ